MSAKGHGWEAFGSLVIVTVGAFVFGFAVDADHSGSLISRLDGGIAWGALAFFVYGVMLLFTLES